MSLLNQAIVDLYDRDALEREPGVLKPDSSRPYFVSPHIRWLVLVSALAICCGTLTWRQLPKLIYGHAIPEDVGNIATLSASAGVEKSTAQNDHGGEPEQSDGNNRLVGSEIKDEGLKASSQLDSDRLLNKYLSLAVEAIADIRLSLPHKNNALYFINQALLQDAENDRALSLLEQVKESYAAQFDHAIRTNNTARARFLLSRISYFTFAPEVRHDYEERYKVIADQESILVSSKPLSKATVEPSAKDTTLNHNKPLASSWLTKSDASIDQQYMETAKTKIENGDSNAAVLALVEFVKSQPNAEKSSVFLVDYLVSQKRGAELRALSLPESHIAYYYANAKRLMLHGRDAEAIGFLLSASSRTGLRPSDEGLLAGLLHKHERYAEAQALYGRLLRAFPKNTTYLLGYAVSSDNLGMTDEALLGYRHIIGLPRVERAVLDFVKGRIQQLNPAMTLEASR